MRLVPLGVSADVIVHRGGWAVWEGFPGGQRADACGLCFQASVIVVQRPVWGPNHFHQCPI